MEQKLNIDLSKTQPVLTKEGGKIWNQGFVLRKVSRFLTGDSEDRLLPVQVFYCPQTMEISREGIPPGMEFLFEDEE